MLVHGGSRCDKHKVVERSQADSRRGSSTERGYGYKWQKAREQFLRENPLCVQHQANGQVVRSTVVDHKIPHKGDQKLFWSRSNWQALCKPCHDEKTAREDGGFGNGGGGVEKSAAFLL